MTFLGAFSAISKLNFSTAGRRFHRFWHLDGGGRRTKLGACGHHEALASLEATGARDRLTHWETHWESDWETQALSVIKWPSWGAMWPSG